MSEIVFEYHSLGFEHLEAIGLLWEALPPDVGAELLARHNAGEVHVGMEPIELSPAYGFKWKCGHGLLDTGVHGFSLHITPDKKDIRLTVAKVKWLEKSVLKRTVLSHRHLIVMPHSTDAKIRTDMIWNLNKNKHWSTGIG